MLHPAMPHLVNEGHIDLVRHLLEALAVLPQQMAVGEASMPPVTPPLTQEQHR